MNTLFNQKKINNIEIKNAIVMPPMCMYKSDEDSHLKDFHFAHYNARAIGGVGLIIVEATAVEKRGRISNNDLGLYNDEQVLNHKILNNQLHKYGTKTAIQLAHAGRKSVCTNSIPIAPSAIKFSDDEGYKTPKEMTSEDIKEVKNLFVNAAIRAKDSGYDMIELHAAHGYLLCEFLSPITNQRLDEYGGTLNKRCKLTLEIASEIIKATNLPLIVRISAEEWEENGWEIKQSIYLCQELEKIGVDAIHVSAGGNIHKPSLIPNIEPLYQVNYAKQIKENIKIPVIAVGLITTAQEAEMLLNNDYCDFVAFGRELLRNPNLPSYIAHEFNIDGVIDKSYLRAFI